MPKFTFQYERKQSPVTGLFADRPMITVRLRCLPTPEDTAATLRFRIDTGANMSAVPLSFAADVLNCFPRAKSPTAAELVTELKKVQAVQGLQRIDLTSASGKKHTAYPLWIPVELVDDHGELGEFDALIAFVEVQAPRSFLAGLTGFLDKFDVSLRAREFALEARPGCGVRCPYHATAAASGG